MTQKTANGEVLTDLKTLRFRVFEPGNKISHLTTIQARPGMVFTEEGIQQESGTVCERRGRVDLRVRKESCKLPHCYRYEDRKYEDRNSSRKIDCQEVTQY